MASPSTEPKTFFQSLGPGLITGAADDDPSGISTYSVAGAAFGYAPLWTALFSFPMMTAVQMMCARLGVVTKRGLAGSVRKRYPRWVLWSACALLIIANTFNIGADLAGMSEVTTMITGVKFVWAPVYAIVIVALLFWSNYRLIVGTFKWLTLALFAYVIAGWLAKPDWSAVLHATFLPHFEMTREYMSVLVGILGTTISPYLFFWQASQEVEEGRSGKETQATRLRSLRIDTLAGMLFSNVIMYFIILTTAATLHLHGKTDIATAKQAAEALKPLGGTAAYWLFSLGVIGTGMLGVPVLAGSCAYAISEAAVWKGTLDCNPPGARKFYTVIGFSMIVGLALDIAHLNPVRMLFWSAVLNGVLAPPLIALVILLTSDSKVMGKQTNSPLIRWLGWLTFAAMSLAVVGMVVLQ